MYIRKYSMKSIGIIIFTLLLVYEEITGKFLYLDEILALVAVLYIIRLGCLQRITKNDMKIILGIITLVLIGIISNIIYRNVDKLTSILIDILTVTKIFVIYIMFKYTVRTKSKNEIIRFMLPIAKVYSICAFICALLSLFIDLGMAGEKRYGIPSFHFIFPMEHQFTSVTIFMLSIILVGMEGKFKYKKYILINCFSIFLTTKGPAIIFSILFIYLILYFKKNEKIKIWQFIVIGIVVMLIGSYQIQTYLLNTNAPRSIFFKYGFEIANSNFPFGSGLASYGSAMAAKDYSKLYYEFGFNNLFGMNKIDGSFLYDVGLACIIGQFGWIGFIIYAFILYKLLISSTNGLSNINKAFVYAVLIQFLIHSTGAAILNSSAAIIAIIGIGIIAEPFINKNITEYRGV